MFRSEGKQLRVAFIFRGAGKPISDDEKQAWHPEIDVFFQSNAWLEQTLLSFIE